jgi:hypothetical protein
MTKDDDELLARAEAWLDRLDPAAAPARDTSALRRIGLAQSAIATANDELRAAVRAAREEGYPWSAIGRALGVTKQAAQERFREPAHS